MALFEEDNGERKKTGDKTAKEKVLDEVGYLRRKANKLLGTSIHSMPSNIPEKSILLNTATSIEGAMREYNKAVNKLLEKDAGKKAVKELTDYTNEYQSYWLFVKHHGKLPQKPGLLGLALNRLLNKKMSDYSKFKFNDTRIVDVLKKIAEKAEKIA